MNPSPNQLFRALGRKDKAIEVQDAESVATVHEMITNATWEEIVVYENLHKE